MVAKRSDVHELVRSRAHLLAWLWLRGLLAVASIVLVGVISILLGFNAFIENSPIVELVRLYPITSVITVAIFVGITLIAILIARAAPPEGGQQGPEISGIAPRLAVATVLASVSTSLFVALLLLVLIRPAWCPSALCMPNQVSYYPNGVHDDVMEAYLNVYQSRFYVIPGKPDAYDLNNLPNPSVGAVNLAPSTASPSACSIFVGVHSLRTGGFDILIEQVHVVVQELPPLPSQLDVWQPASSQIYHGNAYQVIYRGESSGTELMARYLAAPVGFVQLAPREVDALELRLSSTTPADIKFKIQVTYRLANESNLHTLTLPQVFEVAFSNKSNWHQYELVNGRLVPAAQ